MLSIGVSCIFFFLWGGISGSPGKPGAPDKTWQKKKELDTLVLLTFEVQLLYSMKGNLGSIPNLFIFILNKQV